MNGDRYFVDSNVILYRYDELSPAKRDLAKLWLSWLWENKRGVVSWQVLQEFYWNALRKFRVPPALARHRVELMSEWHPPQVTMGLLTRAWHWTDNSQVSFWDGLILAAAEQTQCRFLLSEDFQAGRKFDSVTVVNPFETSPPAPANNGRPA